MSRHPYEPCKLHKRTYCSDYDCKREEREDSSDNLGRPSINTEGHLSIGIGSGLAIDPTDGSLGFDMGGFTIDTA